jgi:thiamine pyrophosphokinase
MRAFIFCGGEIFPDGIEERAETGDLVVAADSGYNNAQKLGAKIDLLVGDFDSIEKIPDDVGEIFRVPAEKNETDTQLAVELALGRGADEIIIVGSTSGRFDHAASLLAILEDLWDKRIPAIVVNGHNRVRFLRNSGVIILRSRYKYFSIVALDEKVKGVSIEGAKYPLKNKEILRREQFAISNEIVKNCALITVKKGAVYVVESRDAATAKQST